jgi:hypothetical protein
MQQGELLLELCHYLVQRCKCLSSVQWSQLCFCVDANIRQERVDKDLLSFGSIADGAQWLVEYCTSVTGAQFPFTAGQIFHQTNWNVIVTNPGPCE